MRLALRLRSARVRRRTDRRRLSRRAAPRPVCVRAALLVLHQLFLGRAPPQGVPGGCAHLPELWLPPPPDRVDLRSSCRPENLAASRPAHRAARVRPASLATPDGVRVLTAVVVVTQGRVGSMGARAVRRGLALQLEGAPRTTPRSRSGRHRTCSRPLEWPLTAFWTCLHRPHRRLRALGIATLDFLYPGNGLPGRERLMAVSKGARPGRLGDFQNRE